MDYDLESGSEDELNQPVQNIIQNNQPESPTFKTNDEIPTMNNRKEKHEKVIQKEHKKKYNEDVVVQSKFNSDNIVTPNPVEQPQIIYDKNAVLENRSDINATKTKPFQIKETPKKNMHIKK